jgi:hypothetical protein
MTRTPPSLRATAAIARGDLTDRLRAGVGAALFVQPAVLLLVLLMGVVAPNLVSQNLGSGIRTIAVEKRLAPDSPAAGLLAELTARHPRFVLRPVDDVADDVAQARETIGLVLAGTAEDPDQLRVVVLPSRRTSTLTAAEVMDALRTIQLDQAGAPAPLITRTKMQRSGEAGRIGIAGLLPFLIAFQLVGLYAEASIRVRGGKTDRSAEVFHVLPVHRLDLVLGRAAVGLGDGLLRLGAMLLIVAALPFLPPSIATFSLPGTTIAVLVAAGACQVIVATAGGTLLGALVRTETQENVIQSVLALGLTAGFLGLTFSSVGELPRAFAAVPFLGPTSWARNTFLGGGGLVEAVLSLAVTGITTVAALGFAARALDRDGVTLREA